MKAEDLAAVVITSVADAIGPESSLIDELGAESIDLLDMWFRIEEGGGQRGGAGPSRASTTAVPPRFIGQPTAK